MEQTTEQLRNELEVNQTVIQSLQNLLLQAMTEGATYRLLLEKEMEVNKASQEIIEKLQGELKKINKGD